MNMTAMEMKYALFKDIDSINDESMLHRLTAFVKEMLLMPQSCNVTDTSIADESIDDNFGNVDFGYPKTFEEVEAELEKAETERDDPSKWVTSEAFHHRLEQKYPWLR
jgi:hypothetical protein